MEDVAENELSILVGGEAGQGVESSGAALSLAFARGGLHVFSTPDYRSRIRGGHNFFQIRASQRPVHSQRQKVHLALALTQEAVRRHTDMIESGAAMLFPESFEVDEESLRQRGVQPCPFPLQKIAEEHGSRMMLNTAAMGAAAGLISWPFEFVESVLRDTFAAKGEKVVGQNLAVAGAAHAAAQERYGSDFPFKVEPLEAPARMLINGNQAFGMGAVAAGCRFMAAYPMTPATSIIEYLSALPPQLGVVTKQAEDEIAAVCMALGASYAGARAMTATSGGGFCLMVEALGLAGMTEVPVVVVDAQRGGPSTGLPTRTEQADLLFVINSAQGEFPRIVLAPSGVDECFEVGWRAFNLADKYQCPVIVLTDLFMASSLFTVDKGRFDFSSVEVDRGATLTTEELDRMTDGYKRFEFTESGVSPRALPGHKNAVYAVSSDEHTEFGHADEEIENRRLMMEKRMRKLGEAVKEMRGPERYGPQEADVTLVCWGSTFGPCRDAADIFNEDGGNANVLCFADLWPFPAEEAVRALELSKRAIGVEQNYNSQLAQLIRMSTGRSLDGTINKYDGRPFVPEEIIAALDGG